MYIHPLWSDEYWPLVIQLYLKKPEGVKPPYSQPLVNLSLELHIPPQVIHSLLKTLASSATPSLRRMTERYAKNRRRLTRDVEMLRQMRGFGTGGAFYNGVETDETFEHDFRPIAPDTKLTPSMLILILDLYFCLTPLTMTASTPEVQELAALMSVSAGDVAEVLHGYLVADPCINNRVAVTDRYAEPCRKIWKRLGNGDTKQVKAAAMKFMPYFAK